MMFSIAFCVRRAACDCLPERASPIDFAYAIHTELGNKCVGARGNDQLASLDTSLKSGDVVEILTDKNRKARAWNG